MGNHNNWNISTQQIQIFLKSVELKNFTQVANHFNFTPSMVSKTITALENDLNLKLFIRKPHELTPTPSAIYLAKEWKQYYVSINNSIIRAQSYEEDLLRKIELGFVDSSSNIDQLISNSIKNYLSLNPHIRISIEKHDMHRAAELLNSGLLDIIITSGIEVSYLEEHYLPWEWICDSEVVVYVPKGNNLFHKDCLSFEDIKDQTFLSLNSAMHPSYNLWLLSLCAKHGFIPEIVTEFRTVRSLMFNLKLNNHLFIGDSITSDWCDENLKMFLLPEKSFSLVSWRPNYTQELMDFKEYLKTIYPKEY